MSSNLGDLLKKAGFAASPPAPEAAPAAPPPAAPAAITFGAKVVVRVERKGHGGKTVTVLTGITSGLPAACDRLKRELGTAARIDGDALIVHGDHRERLARWLEANGATKVVRGS